MKVHSITALQTEYSLWSRDPEEEILETCRELGIGFVAYSPLGRGFLTGQFTRFEDFPEDDYRRFSPRFQGENFQKNLVPIPGTKRRKYLEQNVAALDVKLSEDDVRRIDEIFPTGVAAGDRYPEHMMSIVNG